MSEDPKETPEEDGVKQEETKPEHQLDTDDEARVEDGDETTETEKAKPPTPMKTVTTESWIHLNDVPPLWQR